MIVDIFNHFMPKSCFDRLAEVIPGHMVLTAFPRLKTLCDIDARRRLLDQIDGFQQVLSLANPPIELVGPPDRTPELARLANDALADICHKYPDRFPAFIAAMPTNNVDASLMEIDRAIRDLGARGIQLFTNVAGEPLSAPKYRPIFRRMVEHDLPIWIHPMRGPQFSDYASEQASENEIWFSFGWPYETTACMTPLGQKMEVVEGRGIIAVGRSPINGGPRSELVAHIGHLPIDCRDLHSQKQAQLEVGPFEPQPSVYQNQPSSLCT